MIWNWQQMTEVTRSFCWPQNFVPRRGCMLLPRGYIHASNHEKKYIKLDRSDKKFLLTSKLRPQEGLYATAPGLYTCIKSWKEIYKKTSKRFLWNLQQMGKVINLSCWHQNFVPWGLSVPAPGLYTCIKSWRKLYKIRLQGHFFFWNLQQMTEVTRCSCWHQNFVPKGLSAPALGLYTCIKSWIKIV